MRLIVHAGLHKTASTHLQHVPQDHRGALAAAGIHYAHSVGFAAHHRVTWALQDGDPAPFDAMLADARAAGCHTAIFSSENLESGFFRHGLFALIEERAAAAGATVEWHWVLREPGAAFASLHAELPKHVYVDPLWLFAEAMNKGGVYLHQPSPLRGGTPWWFFAFDQERHLDSVAAAGWRPMVHDFAAEGPFPGWRLLDRLGVLDLVTHLPAAAQRNQRLDPAGLRAMVRQRIGEAGGGELASLVDQMADMAIAAVPECARLIGRRYGDSHRRALDRYAVW